MGYFDVLSRGLEDYLYNNYKSDEEIQEILTGYDSGADRELFEIVDREIFIDFIEESKCYIEIIDEEELNDLLIYDEEYINYFMDVSIQEVYNYFTEIDIKTVLLQTDLYKFSGMYYIIWEI